MIPTNGQKTNLSTIELPDELIVPKEKPAAAPEQPEPVTRAKLRSKKEFHQNRFVIFGAGAVVLALLVFVATSMPRSSSRQKPKDSISVSKDKTAADRPLSTERSVLPILDSGRAAPKEDHQGFIDEQDLERSATKRPSSTPTTIAHLPQSSAPGTLGSIPPFGGDQWVLVI